MRSEATEAESAAASRLRRYEAGEGVWQVWPEVTLCEAHAARRRDCGTLAAAWQAGHFVDEAVVADREWIVRVLPATAAHGLKGDHAGPFGRVVWQLARHDPESLTVRLNGSLLPLAGMTRGRFRRLLDALGVATA